MWCSSFPSGYLNPLQSKIHLNDAFFELCFQPTAVRYWYHTVHHFVDSLILVLEISSPYHASWCFKHSTVLWSLEQPAVSLSFPQMINLFNDRFGCYWSIRNQALFDHHTISGVISFFTLLKWKQKHQNKIDMRNMHLQCNSFV